MIPVVGRGDRSNKFARVASMQRHGVAAHELERRTKGLEGRLRVERRTEVGDLRLDDRFSLRRGLGLDDGGLGVFLHRPDGVAVALAEARDLLLDGGALGCCMLSVGVAARFCKVVDVVR